MPLAPVHVVPVPAAAASVFETLMSPAGCCLAGAPAPASPAGCGRVGTPAPVRPSLRLALVARADMSALMEGRPLRLPSSGHGCLRPIAAGMTHLRRLGPLLSLGAAVAGVSAPASGPLEPGAPARLRADMRAGVCPTIYIT